MSQLFTSELNAPATAEDDVDTSLKVEIVALNLILTLIR